MESLFAKSLFVRYLHEFEETKNSSIIITIHYIFFNQVKQYFPLFFKIL